MLQDLLREETLHTFTSAYHPSTFQAENSDGNGIFLRTHTRPTQHRTGVITRYADRLHPHTRRKDIDCSAEIREWGFSVCGRVNGAHCYGGRCGGWGSGARVDLFDVSSRPKSRRGKKGKYIFIPSRSNNHDARSRQRSNCTIQRHTPTPSNTHIQHRFPCQSSGCRVCGYEIQTLDYA